MNKKNIIMTILLSIMILLIIVLYVFSPETGEKIGNAFSTNILTMLKILPLVFILIALFEVWVKKEKVEKHLGEKGGLRSFLWVVILGGTTIGPMIVALPVAASLYRKGARLSVIFTYLGAAAVCRIPMTIFETSYLGVKFTIIRYSVALPLIIVSSVIMGRILNRSGYKIQEE
ncbi:MAG: permease [Spirochaetaceae bacterium]|nr:permease [Spirochaetaceae bacterium]